MAEQLDHGLPSALEGERLLDDPFRPELQTCGLECILRRGNTGADTLVAIRQAGTDGDLGVPVRQDQPSHLEGGVVIGKTDARTAVRLVQRPGQHIGNHVLLKQLEDSIIMVRSNQYHSIHATLDKGAQQIELALGPIFMAGHEQLVTQAPKRLLQGLYGYCKYGVVQRRVNGGNRPRLARSQCSRRTMAHIPQLFYRPRHTLQC